MAINRKDGVLYYADLFDSVPYLTYYDLDKMEIIKQQKFYFSTNKPIYFDGSFVHFAGYTFDTAGEMLSGTNQSRHYNGYNDMRDIKTIYGNQYISVFTGIFNDEYYTIIYDLHNENEIYSFKIRAVDAYIEENKVIIYDNNEKIILFTVE